MESIIGQTTAMFQRLIELQSINCEKPKRNAKNKDKKQQRIY